MRLPALAMLLVLLGAPGAVVWAQPAAPGSRCGAENAIVSASGVVQSRALPYFIEIELTLQNKTTGPIRIDPRRFMLLPDQGSAVAAAHREQVIAALRSPAPTYVNVFGVIWSGSIAVGVGVGPVDLQARTVDARILRPVELTPSVSIRGSVYFHPAAWPAQFALVLDGLTAGSGTVLPSLEVRNCQMPIRPLDTPAAIGPPPTMLRTIPVRARAETGPVTVSVSSAELGRFATALDVTVENAADTEAELFVAIGQARLVDAAGKSYAVVMLRSDLPDRVATRSQVRGRMVFEPFPTPQAVTSAVLTMSGIRVGVAEYDVRIDLQF